MIDLKFLQRISSLIKRNGLQFCDHEYTVALTDLAFFVYSVKKSVFNMKLLEVKNTSLKGSLVACVRRLLWMIDRLRA